MLKFMMVFILISSSLSVQPIYAYDHQDVVIKQHEESVVFRHVKAIGEKGKYVVTGEVHPAINELFYLVEDGHHEFVKETKLKIEKNHHNWSNFKIEVQIPMKELPANATLILYLFERSGKNGQMTNAYPVILERFGR